MIPVLALAGSAGTALRAVPLLKLLGRSASVVSFHHNLEVEGPEPDAIIATSVRVLPELPVGTPTAVWVERSAELRIAQDSEVEMILTSQPALAERGAVLVPRVGIDLTRWPPLAPLVRGRWRQRHGLPEDFIVTVAPGSAPAEASTSLALASAAVVTGPQTAVALALGTPTITSPETAKRLHLRPGMDVEVANGPAAAMAVAREVVADVDRAAVLGRRGRRFAERHLDLGHAAEVIQRRLGLVRVVDQPGTATLEDRLRELATPPGAPLRDRVEQALRPLVTP